MRLKKVIVENYRKFINASLSLNDDLTLLAGANNSGKTSLIDILENILGYKKASFSVSDIPVTISKEWIDHAYTIFGECFDKNFDNDNGDGFSNKEFSYGFKVRVGI